MVDRKEYLRKYQKEWIANRRKTWFDANGPCVKCSSWDDLELDHIDRIQKIDHKVWSWSEKRRLEELVKCQVLCSICHKEKTRIECYPERQHGMWTMYNKGGCRCSLCVEASIDKGRKYRAARKLVDPMYRRKIKT